ncbi:uncharacterized protein LOC112601259 [Melanaphis sacchari]|uniref:uncharacterized protein LOC112601259 n=1 Tax=Melanaphis sacchari TaxID=742174 RepID=UPI000DC1380F|nr:uncharacterized protein LOC112601259 [Melanaphis sacchari]
MILYILICVFQVSFGSSGTRSEYLYFAMYASVLPTSKGNEYYNEYDDQNSRPSTSRGGGGYSDHYGCTKKVTFKANNCRGNHFRKSWDNKTELVRDHLDSEFFNRCRSPKNNTGRRNHNRNGHGNMITSETHGL